jgi:sulfite exporter TauE/SafE
MMERYRKGFQNEDGIALVMVLILSAISLAIMAALLFMLTASTQVSGIQKRYKNALEAGKGGVDITFQLIGLRGNLAVPLPNFDITAVNVGGTNCLTPKLNNPTGTWPAACNSSLDIDPATPATYDMVFELGTAPTFRVFGKIVDTVEGNTGSDLGLQKSGVVSSNSGEVTAMPMPYLYTLEVEAVNKDVPTERARYSILYQY